MHSTADFLNTTEKNRPYNVLFLTKWYPNPADPQLGIFIKKHAQAVALYATVYLVYVFQDESVVGNYDMRISQSDAFTEIKVAVKPNTSVFKPIINGYRYLKANRMAIAEVRKRAGKIDIVHAHVLLRSAVIAFIINVLYNIPYVVTEHWTGYVSGKFQQQSFFKKWLSRKVLKRAKAVTTVSNSLQKSMQGQGLKANYYTVPNVVEAVVFDSKMLKNTGLSDKIKVLSVADLEDGHKNISGAIKAIASIQQRFKNIEYHIIGDGSDKQLLTQLADSLQGGGDFIFFHGRKPNEYVYDFMQHVDFVLINSNYETFSVVAAEALANGKPVISTVCGGPEEFITPDFGILIEPNNQLMLEEALVKMLNTYKSYDAPTLRNYILNKLSYKVVGEQFCGIYDKVLNNKPL
jgi:glycosyltransferase involved in cell wall biosynthesis